MSELAVRGDDGALPLHSLIAQRWSPRGFRSDPVDAAMLARVFEAARWSASCFNAQPWRFIVASMDEGAEYQRLLNCLVAGNQAWAKQAPVLGLGLAKRSFSHNGKRNDWCWHDLGMASAQLALQAQAEGLYLHFMGGIEPEKARELFNVPEDFDIVTGFALGYLGSPDGLEGELLDLETGPRERLPLSDLVFSGGFGQPREF